MNHAFLQVVLSVQRNPRTFLVNSKMKYKRIGLIPKMSSDSTRDLSNIKKFPCNTGTTGCVCSCNVTLEEDAVMPTKAHDSDSGYDLTLTRLKSSSGNVEVYHTGVRVAPPEGHYFDMVARSSLYKFGYILANSVGIIDNQYRGEILVALLKTRDDATLELPFRACQLIPRKIINFGMQLVGSLDSTERGTGGFGSTGH